MSIAMVLVLAALLVAAVLTVLSIVVSTSKGADWSMSAWGDDKDEEHGRHARHQRDAEIRARRSEP